MFRSNGDKWTMLNHKGNMDPRESTSDTDKERECIGNVEREREGAKEKC